MRSCHVAVAVLVASGSAHADCPDTTPRAACLLHEEGVDLLTSGRFEEAATKFRAAIAASASARSYLGYSQAVEGQGKVALAYETMLVAQRLSNEEMAASGGKDTAIVGRSERIKYKLSDLGGKIGFVWLRVPEGVPPRRLVSVHREREGDLPSPLGRWITVAPNRQLLIATLDDGTRLEMVAAVAPGAQSNLVIPIPPRPSSAMPPVTPAPAMPAPVPAPAAPQPPANVDQVSPPPPSVPSTVFAIGASLLAPGGDTLSTGSGLTAIYEQRLGRSPVGLTGHVDYVFHPSQSSFEGATLSSGSEVLLLVGLRTMSRGLHARFDVGIDLLTIELDDITFSSSTTDVYPCASIGGGIQVGRLRMHASAFWTGVDDISLRFMGTLAVDLFRR